MIGIGKLKTFYYILAGTFLGLVAYGAYISKVFSYLSDDPAACINCHIMTPQFATWFHSSHRKSATCNDCHVPQDNKLRALWFKINDGIRHSTLFTVASYPQVIKIRDEGAKVVQENCTRCHSNQLSFVSIFQNTGGHSSKTFGRQCWDCHREVPHGRIASQASTPNAIVPIEMNITPLWIKKELNLLNKMD